MFERGMFPVSSRFPGWTLGTWIQNLASDPGSPAPPPLGASQHCWIPIPRSSVIQSIQMLRENSWSRRERLFAAVCES